MFITCRLPHWLDFPKEKYLQCARIPGAGLGIDPDFIPLLQQIRSLFPVDGDEYVKDIAVCIEPGQSNHQGQKPHAHDEYTAVFYVDPADVAIIIEGERILPAPGDLVIMEPGTQHHVEPSHADRQRLSFAMLVPDPDIPSKFAPMAQTPGGRGVDPPSSFRPADLS